MNIDARNGDLAQHKERVAASLRDLAAGTEDLLKSTAAYSGGEIEAARGRLKRQLETARLTAREWEASALDKARRVSAATDGYVHENAWKSVGVAALAGVLLGCCLLAASRR